MDKCIYCKGRGLRADLNDELCDVCLGTGLFQAEVVSQTDIAMVEEAPVSKPKKVTKVVKKKK